MGTNSSDGLTFPQWLFSLPPIDRAPHRPQEVSQPFVLRLLWLKGRCGCPVSSWPEACMSLCDFQLWVVMSERGAAFGFQYIIQDLSLSTQMCNFEQYLDKSALLQEVVPLMWDLYSLVCL